MRSRFRTHKLRMMGETCEGPAYLCGDNQSVLANITVPESTLKKKYSPLARYLVLEGVAMVDWNIAYVNANNNDVDFLTKVFSFGAKRRKFASHPRLRAC